MKQEIKIGDHVHVGHMVKGGAGVRGVVTSIGDDGSIMFKSHEDNRKFKGHIKNATLEKAVAPRNESVEESSYAPVAPAPGDRYKDTAIMVNNRGRRQRVQIHRKHIGNYPKSDGWMEVSPGQKDRRPVTEESELDESLKTHYQNGYHAQKKGKTRQDNPHREGSPAASMWAKGWEHASDKKEPQKFTNEEVEGVSEAGPFSYGAKAPRKGSISYNAMIKRKEQEKNIKPIEPKDQMVGSAKLRKEEVENVAEGLSKRDQQDVAAIKAVIERLQAQLSHPNADKDAIQQSIAHEKKRLALYGQGVAEGLDETLKGPLSSSDYMKGATRHDLGNAANIEADKQKRREYEKKHVKTFIAPKEKEAQEFAKAHGHKVVKHSYPAGHKNMYNHEWHVVKEEVENVAEGTNIGGDRFDKVAHLKSMSNDKLNNLIQDFEQHVKKFPQDANSNEYLSLAKKTRAERIGKKPMRKEDIELKGTQSMLTFKQLMEMLDEADQLSSRMPSTTHNQDGRQVSDDERKRRQSFLKKQMKFRKTLGGMAGPKPGQLPEEVELDDVEQIDELQKSTLASYAGKAAASAAAKTGEAEKRMAASKEAEKRAKDPKLSFASSANKTLAAHDAKKAGEAKAVAAKRLAGVNRAVTKMAKEEVELDEELKGDMHPDAGKVLKHIKPEHHSVYKPYLKKGTYNGSYKDRSDVLKAAEKAGHTVSEEVDLEEGWEDMKKAVAARMAAGDVRDKSKFDKKEYKTGTVYTRKKETFSDEDDAASDKKAEKQAQTATGEAPVKRGRGRPKGSYGSYKQRSAETKAKAAAKSAATKAANKVVKKESFDDAFVSDLFKELRESEEVLDFIDLLNCDEFQSLDEQSLTVLASHIENALNEIKKQNLESLSELQVDDLILEVLSKDASAGDWIGDFIKSDDPRFKGKSKEKRKQMALAAYYAKQRETK